MERKFYYILIPVVTAVLGVVGFLGISFMNTASKITVPDFLGKDKEDVYEWCGQLSQNYSCELIYEETTGVEKDKVFQQSVSAGNKLEDTITIRISTGIISPIALPDLNDLSKEGVEAWKAGNDIASVSYFEEESESVAAGKVIRIEPTENIYKDTPVMVFISSGDPNAETQKSDDQKSESSDDKIIIKNHDDYAGQTVTSFESKMKTLGLKPNHNTSKDDYSTTVEKGNLVWNGAGTYEKGETINYGLSLGKKEGSSSEDDLYVTKNKYVGKTEEEFKTIASNLGLKPTHLSDRDAYSDTVAKGNIVTHGYGQYEKNEAFNYGLSLGKKDGSSSSEDDLYVSKNQYVGKSESEFKTIASNLGLKATHLSERDAYSDTVAKGYIVTHGYGQYEKNEAFNYGLSLGKKDDSSSSEDDLYVSKNQYVGKSESEFKSIAENLGLKPTHLSERDAYSDSVAKGNIVTHGYGWYENNEAFNYGLSLGPESSDVTRINVESKVGSSESEFLTYLSAIGMKAGNRSTASSSSVGEGKIISHDTGSMTIGSSVNYTVSTGASASTAYIMRPSLYEYCQVENDFNGTKNKMKAALSDFTNVSFPENVSSSTGVKIGTIVSISVNGNESYSAGYYPVDAQIVVKIVSSN